MGRIDITMLPLMEPAGVHGTPVRYMGTLQPMVLWRISMPASMSSDSNENEQPDDERYEVVAPVVLDILHFGHQLAVLVDAVAREVGGDVAVGCADGSLACAHLGHFQQRARLGVALREQQEVVGLLLRQHDEVRLRIPGTQPARRRVNSPERMRCRASTGEAESICAQTSSATPSGLTGT